MNIEYRPIYSHAEYRAAEEIQHTVWGGSELEVVPTPLLLTAHKNGGLVLGAFDQERLVGLAFGFLGRTKQGTLKHCSHLLAVLGAYRNQQIGERLKWFQRKQVLAQGIDLMTWTYDPLESRNAFLNLHKLGAICNTLLPNLYGAMSDGLNAGLPSDRFEVEWHLSAASVTNLAEHGSITASLHQLLDEGIAILNPAPANDPTHPGPIQALEGLGSRILIRFPNSFQQIKASQPELALAWRLHLRECCQAVFQAGYSAVDLIHEPEASYYVVVKSKENGSHQ